MDRSAAVGPGTDADDQSEDGQLRSPYNNNEDDDEHGDDNSMDGGDTADSLDIKPPQAAGRSKGTSHRYKEKKTSRAGGDKKHSKEHRHKDRERISYREERRHGSGTHRSADRIDRMERDQRHQQQHQQQQQQQPHHHNMRQVAPQTDRYEMHPREREHYRHVYKESEREKRAAVKASEHERGGLARKDSPGHKSEAERALEDLRSRLLSKRSKQDADKRTSGGGVMHNDQSSQHDIEYRNERDAYRYEQFMNKRGGGGDKVSARREHREHKDNRKHVIEVIDSPENYNEMDLASNRYKDRHNVNEDPELIARRAKLLDAEREMARRKEMAREELEARREMRRERDDALPVSPSPPPPLQQMHKTKRRSSPNEETLPRKRSHREDGVVHISDNSMDNDDDDDDDDDRGSGGGADDDTASDTDTNSQTEDSDERGGDIGDESEGELPVSPLSVGELSKSAERRNARSPRSHSRSVTSKSRSPVSRTPSQSPHSKSRSPRSRSKTRTPSRSPHTQRGRASRSVSSDFELDKNPDQPSAETLAAEAHAAAELAKELLLPNYYPGLQGCRSVEEFQCLNRIEEGTYGVVYRARDKRTEEIVALKRLKMEKEKEGFPITSLREINTLLKGQHPNIVTVREIVVGSNMDKIFIVMDYVEHDLKSLMETMKHRKQSFLPGEVKCLTHQLLRAVGHLHDNWILHRDLKTSNLLLSHKGILKVGDFGLAREYGSPLKAYTSIVVTLWYRAPELLLCCKEYSIPIDMWSVGCIFAEFLSMTALFPGKSEIDQLNRIFKDLGTPNEKIWPGYQELPAVQKMTFTEYPVSNLRKKFTHFTSDLGLSLLQGLLTYDPKQRFSADQGLRNNYFKELPLPIDPAMFPTWPAKSELGARKALASSPKPPSGGGQFKQLETDDNHAFMLNAMDTSRPPTMGPGFSLKF